MTKAPSGAFLMYTPKQHGPSHVPCTALRGFLFVELFEVLVEHRCKPVNEPFVVVAHTHTEHDRVVELVCERLPHNIRW